MLSKQNNVNYRQLKTIWRDKNCASIHSTPYTIHYHSNKLNHYCIQHLLTKLVYTYDLNTWRFLANRIHLWHYWNTIQRGIALRKLFLLCSRNTYCREHGVSAFCLQNRLHDDQMHDIFSASDDDWNCLKWMKKRFN